MRNLVLIGVALMVIGGALLVFNEFGYKEKHEADVFGAKLSVTTRETKRIPSVVGGTVLAVGAIVTVVGAMKKRNG